jgi:hypothetical protein
MVRINWITSHNLQEDVNSSHHTTGDLRINTTWEYRMSSVPCDILPTLVYIIITTCTKNVPKSVLRNL